MFRDVLVQNFKWNFKGHHWNFAKSYEPIHSKNKHFTVFNFCMLVTIYLNCDVISLNETGPCSPIVWNDKYWHCCRREPCVSHMPCLTSVVLNLFTKYENIFEISIRSQNWDSKDCLVKRPVYHVEWKSWYFYFSTISWYQQQKVREAINNVVVYIQIRWWLSTFSLHHLWTTTYIPNWCNYHCLWVQRPVQYALICTSDCWNLASF